MAVTGQIQTQGSDGRVPLIVKWDERANEVFAERGSQVISLSYGEARELYKALLHIFGRVSYPEVRLWAGVT